MSGLSTSERIAADWLRDGRRVVAATLVERIGSAPLDPGARMLVDNRGDIEGSVTGGCVEGALVEEAQRILGGDEARIVTYGVSDEEALGVGLMCGGTVRVFVHELRENALEALDAVGTARAAGVPVAMATLLDGERAGTTVAIGADGMIGSLGAAQLLDRSVERDARGQLDEGLSRIRRYGPGGEVMGSEIAVYIQAFATRFSANAEVVVDWPDRYLAGRKLGLRDVVLVFTHDPKFDEPALVAALESGAGYVGALGSRRTQERRARRLRDAGLDERSISEIHAPCGLDVGARTPAETAISILAEVIAVRTERTGEPLRETSGPIHPTATGDGSRESGAPV